MVYYYANSKKKSWSSRTDESFPQTIRRGMKFLFVVVAILAFSLVGWRQKYTNIDSKALLGSTSPLYKHNEEILPPTTKHAVRFVFLVGIEGTGHHLFKTYLEKSPSYRLLQTWNLEEDMVALNRLLFNFRFKGDALWSRYCLKTKQGNKDTATLRNEIVAQMQRIEEGVLAKLEEFEGKTSPMTIPHLPMTIPVNAVGETKTMERGYSYMISYPTSRNCRFSWHPDVSQLYDACDAAGYECLQMYAHRDPYEIVQSTTDNRAFYPKLAQIQLSAIMLARTRTHLLDYASKTVACYDYNDPDTLTTVGRYFGWTDDNEMKDVIRNVLVARPPMSQEDKERVVPLRMAVSMQSMAKAAASNQKLCLNQISGNQGQSLLPHNVGKRNTNGEQSNVQFVFYVGLYGGMHDVFADFVTNSPLYQLLDKEKFLPLLEKMNDLLVNIEHHEKGLWTSICISSEEDQRLVDTRELIENIVDVLREIQKKAEDILFDVGGYLAIPINVLAESFFLRYPTPIDDCEELVYPTLDEIYVACDKAQVSCGHVYERGGEPKRLLERSFGPGKYDWNDDSDDTDVVTMIRWKTLMAEVIRGQMMDHEDRFITCFDVSNVHSMKEMGLFFRYPNTKELDAVVTNLTERSQAPSSVDELDQFLNEEIVGFLEILERVIQVNDAYCWT